LVKIGKKFNESKDTPGVPRYVPPVSGAITWSRLILNIVKTGILRFLHSQPDIFEEEEGKTEEGMAVNGYLEANRGEKRRMMKEMTECKDGQQKEKLSSMYTTLDKEVKKSARKDERQFYDTLATEAEQIKARYISLAEELRKYEQTLHKNWEAEITSCVSLRLNQPVLSKCLDSIPFDQVSKRVFILP
ncbi:unnamed protein product, partial [Trichobilharzia regenti]